MLNNDKKQLLDQLIANLSQGEIAWTSGYLAGLAGEQNFAESTVEKLAIDNLSIIYVTETGNTKFLSGEIAKKLKSADTNAKIKAANQYRFPDLVKEKNIIFVVSTHGDGEIPEAGKKFFAFLKDEKPNLEKTNYLVVALGDTNYPLFCQSGKDFDTKLSELKAKRLNDVIELNLDFEQKIDEVYNTISVAFGGKASGVSSVKKAAVNKSEYVGEIVNNINLNDIGSNKETHHIEIAVDDEFHYEPGDSIGIIVEAEDPQLQKVKIVKGKITPRLYSIASSLNEHGNEVHLTVSVLRYKDEKGNVQKGLISNYLSSLKVGDKVKFYVSKNRQFKLPAENKDIIMVGPGTGIAPFRAFIAERNHQSVSGKSWLFFGEQTFQNDFLYQTEWQDYLNSGALTKLSLAFSRDQKEKIYVQNRIKENAQDVYNWLENGAYFYICGDKENMAKDVENTLIEVVSTQGKKTADEAKNYLEKLAEEGRYLKDVY